MHITYVEPVDAAGQWSWRCVQGDADASGYDDPEEVVAAAVSHAPLAADSHHPTWAEIGEAE